MQWQAIYDDGSVHTQAELESHSKVDYKKLRQFQLIHDGKLILSVFFDGSKKPIFRIRHIVKGMAPTGGDETIIYLVGWQPKKGEPVIFYVSEDGHIEADGSRNNLELMDFEKWEDR